MINPVVILSNPHNRESILTFRENNHIFDQLSAEIGTLYEHGFETS